MKRVLTAFVVIFFFVVNVADVISGVVERQLTNW